MFCGFKLLSHCWLVHNQTWCRKKGVLAESEATFPLSHSWKMMRPICSMQGQTVPCRLTDFKAVRLCYVPPSLILGAAGGLFFLVPILSWHSPRYWQTYSMKKHTLFSRCIYSGRHLYSWSIPPSLKQIIMCYNNRFCFVLKVISWVSHTYLFSMVNDNTKNF